MDNEKKADSREFTRVPIKVEAEIRANGQTLFCHETRDVSMNGLFMTSDKPFERGTHGDISLILEGGMRIEVKGVVEHSSPKGMGIRFTEIGLDSYSYLQNLIMYNSPDTHKSEQEIHDHLGLKRRG